MGMKDIRMKHITIGIIAHVDAGKTTLSEGILFESGEIKKAGRVDNKDTVFDTDEQERERGITIFSKQGEFKYQDTEFTLLDTPGHVDFAAEMERNLQVLDYAILVISGSDGVQSHTRTLWRLLKQYKIPCFIFVNKMDQPDNDRNAILANLKLELSDAVIDMKSDNYLEEIAINSNDETLLESYMEQGTIADFDIRKLVYERRIVPCYFGSALKLDGIKELLSGLDMYTQEITYPEEFGARVYKITRDEKGNRLTHLKVMGGKLKVKDGILETEDGDVEKVNQIRIYNGESYVTKDEVVAGTVCAVTGLTGSHAGQGIGSFGTNNMELIEPVISYRMTFDYNVSARQLYPKIKELEEELPELMTSWDERDESIYIKLMGQMQIEVLTNLIKERFKVVPIFDEGRITYKETVAAPVIGVGHFEPLRHYAEAHIRIEPGEIGSGIEIAADCSEDILDKNWQRLIMTHLRERTFLGTAVGGVLTDVKFTVINGRAHTKHTEGGDFRQATYRAVRQGLMEAGTVILEPYYNFIIDIPDNMIGRAMTDIENKFGTINAPELHNGRAILKGYGPVSTLRDYQINLNAYTSGNGTMSVSLRGYAPCHNEEEVCANSRYDAEADTRNPSSSVFCEHGSGFIVPWDQVKSYMHVFDEEEKQYDTEIKEIRSRETFDYSIGLDEIDQIFAKTFASNKKSEKSSYKKKHTVVSSHSANYRSGDTGSRMSKADSVVNSFANREKLLVVDGYNVIFAWENLSDIAKDNINAAKDKLISVMSNLRTLIDEEILIVFDGYKNKGSKGSEEILEDVKVVHTKEDVTADAFIERFTHDNIKKYDITVASSDGLIQTITRGNGCKVISSRNLYEIMVNEEKQLRENYNL